MNIWIAFAAVAVLVAIGLIAMSARRARTAELREHFGNEYERTVSATSDRGRAEQDLIARSEEVKTFNIRPLTAAERDRYRGDWKQVEARFVDRPTTAVVEADELVGSVMLARGYPMAEFEKHVAHLSVKHPRVVEHYRAGHATIETQARGAASTEDLRQAMLHYRALFDELVSDGDDVAREIPVEREAAPRPIVRQPAPDEYPRDETRK